MAGTLIISGFRTSRHTPCPALSSSCRLNSLLRGLHTHHVSCSPLHRYPKMADAARRRIHGDSVDKGKQDSARAVGKCGHHDHEQTNSHSHSHGIFGGHSHSHGHDHDHGGLIETLQSGGAHRPSSLYRTHPVHCIFLSPLPPFSSLWKVTEAVASRLLDWAQMFS